MKKSKVQEVLYAWLCTKVYIPNYQESIALVHQLAKQGLEWPFSLLKIMKKNAKIMEHLQLNANWYSGDVWSGGTLSFSQNIPSFSMGQE